MKIKVLGTGCPKCHLLETNAKKAVEELGLEGAEVEHVTDMAEITQFGVMSVPALVVEGEVKAAGRIPEVEEIKSWLKSLNL